MAWHEDEENDESNPKTYGDQQSRRCTFAEHPSNVWFSDAGPIHERVFAEAGEGEDRI